MNNPNSSPLCDLFPTSTNGNGKRTSGGKAYESADKAIKGVDFVVTKANPDAKRNHKWCYQDTVRKIVAWVIRWDKQDGAKVFRPISLHADGWRIKDPPGLWPLYRLPEITSTRSGPIVVVEGEKCADAAASVGLNATTSAHGAKSPAKTDWTPLAGRDVVILPDADEAGESYARAVAKILRGLDPPAHVKIVRLPGLNEGEDFFEFRESRCVDGKEDDEILQEVLSLAACDEDELGDGSEDEENFPGDALSARDGRPEIIISTDEHHVNTKAVESLGSDDTIFQRGGILVRIVRDTSPAAKGIRRPMSPRIEILPAPILRERMTAVASWIAIRHTKDGAEERPAHPPAWCVSAVHARGCWPGIRHLEAVVDYPVLRPDGSILMTNGYDHDTGLLLEMHCDLGELPHHPTLDEAIAARDRLLEVVTDFPFERPVHRAAWLAGLVTPLCRFAFTGPAPLFLVDANTRAAGKGLLLDVISGIITGERFTIATYTQDEDELRKRITSLAMSGERLVLFDNLDGKFGNATLDAALTGTSWEDRVLGANRMAKSPLYMTWFATGNNVQIAADTARRICHSRLESPCERPEDRAGFRYPDLLAWVGLHRAELLRSALTILRGYVAAGRPDMKLSAWGSFDGWSRLVRAAIVWVGLPDPGETRIQLQDQADTAAESMGLLLNSWEQLDGDRRGLTTSEAIDRLRNAERHAVAEENCRAAIEGLVGKLDARALSEAIDRLRNAERHAVAEENCRAAIEGLVGKLDARALGYKLRQYRRRIFQGKFFDRAGTSHQAIRWAVFGQAEFHRDKHAPHPPCPPQEKGGWEHGEDLSPDIQSDFSGPYAEGI